MTDNQAAQPSKVPFQGLANRITRGLLRTPVLAGIVGKRLITLYVVGRTSGKLYSIPVAYTPHDGILLIGSGFPWTKNLRTGDRLPVRYRGRRLVAEVELLTDEPAVVRDYAVIARGNPTFARANKITLDPAGDPTPESLHKAWQAGARVLRLTLPA
ncbi:hypothetical protein [Actinoplanes sp. NPDC051494]|uniref:hypothetical protein n=1 Tax=Actinoplanes sp. NPDC051494 TaxID=3363907 RepID=UPI0037A90846